MTEPSQLTWSVALKAPNGKKCLSYEQSDPGWKTSAEHDIDDWIKAHVCAQTWTDHLLYNDESPIDKAGGSFAHSKGIVAWNAEQLGWLLHSVPKFPSTFLEEDGKQTIATIPHGETEYGQSFVWLTMPVSRLSEVISQLQMNDPHVYGVEDNRNVWSRRKRAPAKKDALSTIELSDTVTHVAKHRVWAQSIFDDYLAPKFGNLIQETWMRSGYDVTDSVLSVEQLAWPVGDVKWNETNDHAKWCVAQDESKPFVYIGDVNRMLSQKHRGGGGIVIQDAELCKAFKSLIMSTDWVKKDESGRPTSA